MSAYTKGPWEIASYRNYFGFSIWSPHGPCIAERWYQHERTPEQDKEMQANARLIAAAPDLLEALKDAVESATPRVRTYHRQGEDCTELVEETTWEPWVDAARATIAKAEGK